MKKPITGNDVQNAITLFIIIAVSILGTYNLF